MVGIVTRDRRVYKNVLRVDLGVSPLDPIYKQIEYADQMCGYKFEKLYVLKDQCHWFPETTRIVQMAEYRGAEIIYI